MGIDAGLDSRIVTAQVHVRDCEALQAVVDSNAVLFLVSDESRYITGFSLPVDAGSLLK
jgi:(+)-trans-carveol dehydrogenase